MTTTDVYNKNVTEFIDRYNNTDMSSLHQLLLEQIKKDSTVLDIGFGSGRDLQFLKNNGYDIWGIDPSEKFVQNVQKRFPDISNHFIQSSLPFSVEQPPFPIKFNAIITIAMWMHLKREQYEDVVKSIVGVAKDNAIIVISYSDGNRTADERYFEDVDLDYIVQIFKENNFNLIKNISTEDALSRDNISWKTLVFKHR